jgi:DNA-damage-inducible protein J
MPKTANLNIRLDADVKKAAESVYSRYGLSLAEAVTVFLHQSCNVGGLPFDLLPSHPSAGHISRAERQREAFERFMEAMDATPPLPDEFDDILARRVNIK